MLAAGSIQPAPFDGHSNRTGEECQRVAAVRSVLLRSVGRHAAGVQEQMDDRSHKYVFDSVL